MRALLVLVGWAASAAAVIAQAPGRARPTAPPAPPQAPPAVPAPQKAPPAPAPGAVRSFDPARVELAWNNRRWQIVHQGEVLKDFGPRGEQEARLALHVIRDLKLDSRGTIGHPRPVLEYWLAQGEAPRGLVRAGLRALPLDPARLKVEAVRGQWCLFDGPRLLFSFGPSAEDARQALAVVRKYQFDQVGVLGRPAPSMYVFLRRPHDDSPSLPHASPRAAPREMTVPRFSRLAKNQDGTPRRTERTTGPGAGLGPVVAPALPGLTAPSRGRPDRQPFGQRPAIAPAPAGDRTAFDWRQAQVRQVNGEWRLQAGSLTLGRFGANFNEARMALAALRHYRFTEMRRAGEPAVAYYTAPPQSPRGLLLGLPAVSFQPGELQVQNVAGQFALVQGQQVLLRTGSRQEDARKVLDQIKTQGLDRAVTLGDPAKDGMTFFVRSR